MPDESGINPDLHTRESRNPKFLGTDSEGATKKVEPHPRRRRFGVVATPGPERPNLRIP